MPEVLADIVGLAGGGAQLASLALVFSGVLMLVAGAAAVVAPRDPAERRLEAVNRPSAVSEVHLRQVDDRQAATGLGRFVAPQDAAERSRLRFKLAQAGFRSPGALPTYYMFRTVLGLLLPAPLILATIFFSFSVGGVPVRIPLLDLSFSSTVTLIAVLVAAGFYGPPYFLRRRIARRQQAAREGFPYALDMLQVAVEAGLGFDAALNRLADDMHQAHPVLAEELAIVSAELRAGKPRDEVLNDFGKRVGVDEIRAFTVVVVQSIRFGTSIADALRVYASEMRHKRMMLAEEKANKLPVKMSAALGMFMMPALLVTALTPVVIRATRVIFPALAGQ